MVERRDDIHVRIGSGLMKIAIGHETKKCKLLIPIVVIYH